MYDWREWCAYTTWDDSDFTASEMCCVCGGGSTNHTDGAQLPAFDISAHGSDVAVAIASFDVAIDDFTLVELNSFTLDTSHDHDGTSWMEVAYNYYCSNYAFTRAGGNHTHDPNASS